MFQVQGKSWMLIHDLVSFFFCFGYILMLQILLLFSYVMNIILSLIIVLFSKFGVYPAMNPFLQEFLLIYF